jgi:hypothetical protein
MILLCDVAQVQVFFLVHLVILLISTKERCLVCTESTKGMEIFIGAPDGALR